MDSNLGVNNNSNSLSDKPYINSNQNEIIENDNNKTKKINKESSNFISLDQFFSGRKFIGIKFPGKIENTQNAIKSIGGLEEIKKNVIKFKF